jgi:hypothetical protein
MKVRLSLMNFLEFAVWGSYLTCMGIYLGNIGMAGHIGAFYAMQGIVSIFMPALMGIIADRWIPAQRLLGICHLLAALFKFVGCHISGLSVPDIFLSYTLPLCLRQDGMVWLMVKGQVLPFSLHSIH